MFVLSEHEVCSYITVRITGTRLILQYTAHTTSRSMSRPFGHFHTIEYNVQVRGLVWTRLSFQVRNGYQ